MLLLNSLRASNMQIYGLPGGSGMVVEGTGARDGPPARRSSTTQLSPRNSSLSPLDPLEERNLPSGEILHQGSSVPTGGTDEAKLSAVEDIVLSTCKMWYLQEIKYAL